MNRALPFAAAALVLSAACTVVACGDDDTSSNTVSSSTAGGAAGHGGNNNGGSGGTGGGGTGGMPTTATCGNAVAEPGEVCFGNIATTPAGVANVIDLEMVDCDGDGDLDALVLGQTVGINPHLSVLRNNGDGTFVAGPTLPLATVGVIGMAFDPTSNYRARVPVVGGDSLNIVTINNNCEMSTAETFTLLGPVQGNVAAMKIDDDTTSDYLMIVNNMGTLFAVYYTSGLNQVDVLGPPAMDNVAGVTVGALYPGESSYAAFGNAPIGNVKLFSAVANLQKPGTAGTIPSNGTTGAGLIDLVMADVDNDTYGDVMSANKLDNSITIILSKINTFPMPAPDISITGTGAIKGYNPINIAAGDIDGDGDIDLATANEGDAGQGAGPSLTLLLNDGTGAFTIAEASTSTSTPVLAGFPFAVPAKPNEVHLVDLNGDNALDMVFLSGDADIAVMLATP